MATWTLVLWIGVFGNTALTLDGFENKSDCELFLDDLIVMFENQEHRPEYEIGGDCHENKDGVIRFDD